MQQSFVWGQGVQESWTQLDCMRLDGLAFVVVPRLLLRKERSQ